MSSLAPKTFLPLTGYQFVQETNVRLDWIAVMVREDPIIILYYSPRDNFQDYDAYCAYFVDKTLVDCRAYKFITGNKYPPSNALRQAWPKPKATGIAKRFLIQGQPTVENLDWHD